MKLKDIQDNKSYKIINFGNITQDDLLDFYDLGIIEEELIKKESYIKTVRNIYLILIDEQLFSFNEKYAKEIEVEEI